MDDETGEDIIYVVYCGQQINRFIMDMDDGTGEDVIYVVCCGQQINYYEELFIVEKKNSTEESIDAFKNIVLDSIIVIRNKSGGLLWFFYCSRE